MFWKHSWLTIAQAHCYQKPWLLTEKDVSKVMRLKEILLRFLYDSGQSQRFEVQAFLWQWMNTSLKRVCRNLCCCWSCLLLRFLNFSPIVRAKYKSRRGMCVLNLKWKAEYHQACICGFQKKSCRHRGIPANHKSDSCSAVACMNLNKRFSVNYNVRPPLEGCFLVVT